MGRGKGRDLHGDEDDEHCGPAFGSDLGVKDPEQAGEEEDNCGRERGCELRAGSGGDGKAYA